MLGLDIGSYAVKAVVGHMKGEQLQVENAIEVANPIGVVQPTDPAQRQKLQETITSLFRDYKLPMAGVRVSLAESVVSSRIVTMPLLSDAELASAIQWQVEQHIPIPLEELQYEYTVVRRSEKKEEARTMDVLMVGVQKDYINGFTDMLLNAGIDVIDMETDTLSAVRALSPLVSNTENVLLIQLGASSATLALLRQGTLAMIHTLPLGGFIFTRSIEQKVGLDAVRAEEYKRAYGMKPQELEGKVREALQPVLQAFVAEVQKAVRFFGSEHPGEAVQRVFMSGGSLYLPDLLPYLTEALALEVVPAELSHIPTIKVADSVVQSGRFVVAAGLAMKKV